MQLYNSSANSFPHNFLHFAFLGVNDSPALAQANVGISIGTGAEIATEASDMVLVRGRVQDVCTALHLSRVIFRRILLNLMWSMLYNCLGIPIAAGAFFPLIRIRLPPTVAAGAMALSSISVVLSSLSLRLYKPPDVIAEVRNSRRSRRERSGRRIYSQMGLVSSAWSRAFMRRQQRRASGSSSSRRENRHHISGGGEHDDDSNSSSLAADLLENDHLMGSSENDQTEQTESTRCIDNRSIARLDEACLDNEPATEDLAQP